MLTLSPSTIGQCEAVIQAMLDSTFISTIILHHLHKKIVTCKEIKNTLLERLFKLDVAVAVIILKI